MGEDPITMTEGIELIRPNARFRAALSICRYSPSASRQLERFLHPKEQEDFASLRFERRIQSFLLGRFAAKCAAAHLAETSDLPSIRIRNGIFNQPIVTVPGHAHLGVSVSHSGDCGIALAFPEDHPMGIDIEKIDPQHQAVIAEQLTAEEKRLIQSFSSQSEEMLTLFWSAKEALSKILKTGLTTPMHVYELQQVEWNGEACVGYFRNFTQYKSVSFVIDGSVVSVVLPHRTEFNLNISQVQERFK